MFQKKLQHRYITRFSVSAFASMMMATSAFAQLVPPTTVNGALESSDTQGARYTGGSPIGYYYDVIEITVEDAAAFLAELTTGFDSYLVLYSGEFDPSDVNANYVTHNDDGVSFFGDAVINPSANIQDGEYSLVVTSFSGGVTGSYLLTLGGIVLGWGPALEEIAGDQIKVLANEVAQALSASIFSAVKSGLAGGMPVVSREAPGLNNTNDNRTWFQMDYTAIDGTDLDGRFPTMQAGIDFQLENGMIVGAALGYSDFSISSAASDLDGASLSIQPYLGFRSGEVTGAVTLSFGKLDLETTDGAGTAEGDMRALSLSLERPFALGGNQVIASFDGGFGRQEIDSATGSLAGMADTYSTWSYASLGARYEMQAGAALMSFGASVDYNDVGNLDNIAADHYGSDGFTGAVNFGLDYQMGSGSNLYVNAEIGGIGGDALRKSVQAGIDFRF
ncbi:autotransporter outer membrane beta-barrel domain-containing protein [Halocynthiibacter styelae]|uniref:Autotransporter outer membrane beta-barrel domain-containing protein n=1 Tax=Halocynthiibacter styelae TaxID=2761955 RepID=A0A8J7LQX0_9RHOB|nr:autotransporter outer membrane beta-barrel domain-containing protein [Paenihalocynthiibacter styelae]MBI1494882.1 hypothetical protein [Paenihalocynthiibacter styelae]